MNTRNLNTRMPIRSIIQSVILDSAISKATVQPLGTLLARSSISINFWLPLSSTSPFYETRSMSRCRPPVLVPSSARQHMYGKHNSLTFPWSLSLVVSIHKLAWRAQFSTKTYIMHYIPKCRISLDLRWVVPRCPNHLSKFPALMLRARTRGQIQSWGVPLCAYGLRYSP